MAKIENTELKDLKLKADALGLKYAPNANTAQMKALLSDTVTDTTKTEELEKSSNVSTKPEPKNDIQALLARFDKIEKENQNLRELVNKTGDVNKIKEYERTLESNNEFAFSLKLFPTVDYDCPIISWKTVSNYVDLSSEKIKEHQIIEITFLNQEGEEEKKEIQLLQFATFLKRSKPIIAKGIKNLDGTDVSIIEGLNPETKIKYSTIHPKENTFNVTLDYEGQELTILSTYLNA